MRNFIIILQVILFINCSTSPPKPPQRDRRIDDSINASIAATIAAAEEQMRIAKEDNLSMWRTGFYVDEFGEPTKTGVITNACLLSGKFSNSATEGSDLDVKILIDNPNLISIQLFEYAGKNPVKSGVVDKYRIKVKQDTLSPVILTAKNFGDRLTLNSKDSKKLNDMFLNGGNFKFSILEISEYSSSSYFFEIPNVVGYKKALEKLMKK